MDLTVIWAIAKKDLSIIFRKRSLVISLVVISLLLALGFPGIIAAAIAKGKNINSPETLTPLLDAFSFAFVWLPSLFQINIASYTFVGERTEKTLEPLFSTPVSNVDILLGKFIAPLLLAIVFTYPSMGIFMVVMNVVTASLLPIPYFPNAIIGGCALLFLLVGIFTIEFNVITSPRASDPRSAYFLGVIPIIPIMVVYVLSLFKIITLNFDGLLLFCSVVLVIDVVLFYIDQAVFRRDVVLSKEK